MKLIVLITGTLLTLTAFRIINWSKSDKYEMFYSKYARIFMIVGPVLIAIALLLMLIF